MSRPPPRGQRPSGSTANAAVSLLSQETIYILSKEGAGSAAPLTTALTVAIAEAMEERAERSGDRLAKPALFALDELRTWSVGLPSRTSSATTAPRA